MKNQNYTVDIPNWCLMPFRAQHFILSPIIFKGRMDITNQNKTISLNYTAKIHYA